MPRLRSYGVCSACEPPPPDHSLCLELARAAVAFVNDPTDENGDALVITVKKCWNEPWYTSDPAFSPLTMAVEVFEAVREHGQFLIRRDHAAPALLEMFSDELGGEA